MRDSTCSSSCFFFSRFFFTQVMNRFFPVHDLMRLVTIQKLVCVFISQNTNSNPRLRWSPKSGSRIRWHISGQSRAGTKLVFKFDKILSNKYQPIRSLEISHIKERLNKEQRRSMVVRIKTSQSGLGGEQPRPKGYIHLYVGLAFFVFICAWD